MRICANFLIGGLFATTPDLGLPVVVVTKSYCVAVRFLIDFDRYMRLINVCNDNRTLLIVYT